MNVRPAEQMLGLASGANWSPRFPTQDLMVKGPCDHPGG